MLNIFKGLTKAVVSTVTLPVAVVADVVTLGGVLNDKPCYTKKQAEKIMEGIEDATK